ncbi:MAG: alpha/beta hydrolase-fold protein [Planctomycetota bacterium]
MLVLLVATTTLCAQRGRGREMASAKLEHLTFQEATFHSDAVKRDMQYGIYLPEGYDAEANKDRKYPLIVWLHGLWEDHMRFHGRGGAPLLDKAIGDGTLPPCIFVTANGGRSSMYVNREGERWEDLITKDLLGELTKKYRISDRRDERAIMGVSMGGMAALRIAFTQPELFGAVAAHSSAVFCEDPAQLPERVQQMASRFGLDEVFGNPIQKEPWQKANPLCIANGAAPETLKKLRIYFDAGTRDRLGFDEGNTLLHEALDKHKVPHTWRLIDGGGHSWGDNFQGETLPHSFAFVGEMFEKAIAAEKKGGAKGPGHAADDDKGEKPGNGSGH